MDAFWRRKTLEEMTHQEWESLCDGCGRCCLHKLEDEDTGEFVFTRIACRLLDPATGLCRDYAHRFERVPDCIALRPQDVRRYTWLPSTCAYRLIAEGKDLPEWHPLVSKDPDSVQRAGISVRGRCVCETQAGDDIEAYIVDWPR